MLTNRTLVPAPILLTLLGLFALAGTLTRADAQLMVHMKLNNKDFISHEAVKATVTVHNRAGADVLLPSGWLTFDVFKDGRMLSGQRGTRPSTSPFVLAVGKTITKEVNLGSLYPLYDWGNYKVNASVYFPPLKNYFTSHPQLFAVTNPKPFWTQSIGVSRGRNQLASFRQYSLIEHRGVDRTEIYVRLKDTKGGRVYCTYSIGRYINVTKPQATVDSQNRLHIMHMTGKRIYQHTQVNEEGSFLGAELFKEAGRARPTLMIDSSGVVKVKGGVPYDPARERAATIAAKRGRMATERPPGLPE